MQLRFEWDWTKAEANWRLHGVAFEQAARAILDAFAVEVIDDREEYGEERINLLGMVDDVMLHVTYTERGDTLRIISARRAGRREQDSYFRARAR